MEMFEAEARQRKWMLPRESSIWNYTQFKKPKKILIYRQKQKTSAGPSCILDEYSLQKQDMLNFGSSIYYPSALFE